MGQSEAKFIVEGMHCRSCSALVDMTVGDIEGVESSSTDLVEKTTVVVFDDAVTDVESIKAAIDGAGYSATPVA